jgi:hypothetical protein
VSVNQNFLKLSEIRTIQIFQKQSYSYGTRGGIAHLLCLFLLTSERMSTIPLPTSAATNQPITVASLMERLPVESKLLVQNVIDYAAAMSPKKRVTEAIGLQNQTKLFHTLMTLINKVEESHRLAYAAVFLVIEENRNLAFAEISVFRFGSTATFLTKEKRKVFRSLLHLFITVAPRNTRTLMLRQIDLDKVLADPSITAIGRDRIKSFLEQFKR